MSECPRCGRLAGAVVEPDQPEREEPLKRNENKRPEPELFAYEGPGCWPIAAGEGATGMALWGSLVVLAWRAMSWAGWVSFSKSSAVLVMVIAVVLGAGLGLLEHLEHHEAARLEKLFARYENEQAADTADEAPAGEKR